MSQRQLGAPSATRAPPDARARPASPVAAPAAPPGLTLAPFAEAHRAALLAALNRGPIALTPDCQPLTLDARARALTSIVPGNDGLGLKASQLGRYLPTRQLLLALAEGCESEVVGFVDFGTLSTHPSAGRGTVEGHIRYLWFEPGRRAAGQALLEAAERTLRSLAVSQEGRLARIRTLKAFALPYLAFHKHLSDRLVHIRALFSCNGYSISGGEVYMSWPDFSGHLERLEAEGSMPDGVALQVQEATFEPEEDESGLGYSLVQRGVAGSQPWFSGEPSVELRDDDGRPAAEGVCQEALSTETRAVDAEGRVLGVCRALSGNTYDASDEHRHTAVIAWISVPPGSFTWHDTREGQGQGLGKRLLAQSLVQMARR